MSRITRRRLLLPVIFVAWLGSYLVLVEKNERLYSYVKESGPFDAQQFSIKSFDARYRVGGGLAWVAYWPVNYIDRSIRSSFWLEHVYPFDYFEDVDMEDLEHDVPAVRGGAVRSAARVSASSAKAGDWGLAIGAWRLGSDLL